MPLYLLPNLLHPEADPALTFVPALKEIVNGLDGFFVEHPKEARLFLKHFDFEKLKTKPMVVLDKKGEEQADLLAPLERGESWGIVSDAGLPCIADPGSRVVALARKRKIEVKAIMGPSSIFLSLMLSGFDGNAFVFQGYMPRDINSVTIRKMAMTQIFIETPYNNDRSLESLLDILGESDFLCVACDLMRPSQLVISERVSWWRREVQKFQFHKREAIFLIKTS